MTKYGVFITNFATEETQFSMTKKATLVSLTMINNRNLKM